MPWPQDASWISDQKTMKMKGSDELQFPMNREKLPTSTGKFHA
jgi:hypothetical protein